MESIIKGNLAGIKFGEIQILNHVAVIIEIVPVLKRVSGGADDFLHY
jgi:hypothetical protein